MEEVKSILKLCSILFSYPQESFQHNKEIDIFVRKITDKETRRLLSNFMEFYNSMPYKELSEAYVKTFDFSDQTTLYLTYGVFGDNRERGMGFVKLKMEFAKAGFYLKEEELPDYLPLILEFTSVADPSFVKKVYFIHKKGIDQLAENLKAEKSPYYWLIEASIRTIEKVIRQSVDISDTDVKSNTM